MHEYEIIQIRVDKGERTRTFVFVLGHSKGTYPNLVIEAWYFVTASKLDIRSFIISCSEDGYTVPENVSSIFEKRLSNIAEGLIYVDCV